MTSRQKSKDPLESAVTAVLYKKRKITLAILIRCCLEQFMCPMLSQSVTVGCFIQKPIENYELFRRIKAELRM